MDINKLALKVQNRTPKPMDVKGRFAVLIPLINRNGTWEIIYELRSKNITQPGEVSFPGGKVEHGESFMQTAIRETLEELRIDRENINLIGELDFLVSYANFTIHSCQSCHGESIFLAKVATSKEILVFHAKR